MSSILKSLKKLENETDRGLPSESPSVFNSRQALRREISRRRIRVWLLSVIAVGVMVGGGWFLMRSRPVPVPSPPASVLPAAVMKPEKTAPEAIPPTATSPEKTASDLPAPRQPSPPPGEPRGPGMPSPAQRIREAIAARSAQSSQRRAKAVMPEQADIPDASAPQNPGKSVLPPSQPTAGKRSAPNPIAPERVSVPPASTPAKPPAAVTEVPELPPLSADAGLKLEALAWASVPESRFVVINSQIVREGETIEGIKVERIEKEQVVLRKDGKLWQLRHRSQR